MNLRKLFTLAWLALALAASQPTAAELAREARPGLLLDGKMPALRRARDRRALRPQPAYRSLAKSCRRSRPAAGGFGPWAAHLERIGFSAQSER